MPAPCRSTPPSRNQPRHPSLPVGSQPGGAGLPDRTQGWGAVSAGRLRPRCPSTMTVPRRCRRLHPHPRPRPKHCRCQQQHHRSVLALWVWAGGIFVDTESRKWVKPLCRTGPASAYQDRLPFARRDARPVRGRSGQWCEGAHRDDPDGTRRETPPRLRWWWWWWWWWWWCSRVGWVRAHIRCKTEQRKPPPVTQTFFFTAIVAGRRRGGHRRYFTKPPVMSLSRPGDRGDHASAEV